MITAAPHDLNAAICVSYGFYLWKNKDQPEVWRRIAYKKETKTMDAVQQHWVKLPSMNDISRQDAAIEIKAAWKEYTEQRNAYGVKS